jgi:hypothetical protein
VEDDVTLNIYNFQELCTEQLESNTTAIENTAFPKLKKLGEKTKRLRGKGHDTDFSFSKFRTLTTALRGRDHLGSR